MSAPSCWSSRPAALPFCLLLVAALLPVLPAAAQVDELPSPDDVDPQVPAEAPDFASLGCEVMPVFAAEDGDRWSMLRIHLHNFSDRGDIECGWWPLTTSASGHIVCAISNCCIYESIGYHLGNIGLSLIMPPIRWKAWLLQWRSPYAVYNSSGKDSWH